MTNPSKLHPVARRDSQGFRLWRLLGILCVVFLVAVGDVAAQGSQVLFGDVRIHSKDGSFPAESITLVLYGSGEIGRQSVSNRGRYRFSNLKNGEYEIAIEVGGNEIGRIRNVVVGGLSNSPYGFQQDVDVEWNPRSSQIITGILSAEEVYARPAANQTLFVKAEEAARKKKYDQAIEYLKKIVDSDQGDFQAWSILGTIYLLREKPSDAEKSYLTSLEVKPNFGLALLNLGRLRSVQKRFEEAIDPLTRAVESHPESADANMLLGEAYLQLKKGSRAIPHLEQAARFGRYEAHLRLGWLYNAAGLKERAAAEYEQFLQKNPDYAERRKLEEYISANRQR